jgi:O-6-methylguanine DNA methyltransferase
MKNAEVRPRAHVRYAWVHTEIGRVLVAATSRGVCFAALGPSGALDRLQRWARKNEPHAELVEDRRAMRPILDQVSAYARGDRRVFDVDLDLRGTPFQKRVWEADRRIPYGQTRTYAQIARTIGKPAAFRAVGGANGRNPVPLFVPCHRIVAKDGLGGFTGGLHHKRRLLAHEGAALFS